MAEIIARNGNDLTVQVTIKLTGSLMEMENTILDGCNEIGCLATTEALKRFDTDGSPIKLGDTKMTVTQLQTLYLKGCLHITNQGLAHLA